MVVLVSIAKSLQKGKILFRGEKREFIFVISSVSFLDLSMKRELNEIYDELLQFVQ